MTIDLETQNPPLPPDRLIDRVTGGVRQEFVEHDREVFESTGRQSIREMEAALRGIDRELTSFTRVLDFGCGCGRVMRWMRPLSESVELHGCDIDEMAIAWVQHALPFADFVCNSPDPPLPYPNGHFDLVINHSVFTHLDAARQDAWLSELQRVVSPGGVVLLSVHGVTAFEHAEQQMRAGGKDPAPFRATLEGEGLLFIAEDAHVGSSFPDFYRTTFHAPWYVLEHWTRWFKIRALLPSADLGYQDIVIMEKCREGAPPQPIRASRPGPHPVGTAPALTGASRALLDRFARRGVAGLRSLIREQSRPRSAGPEVGQDEESLSPLVHSIFIRMGERINRLESDVAKLEAAISQADLSEHSDD